MSRILRLAFLRTNSIGLIICLIIPITASALVALGTPIKGYRAVIFSGSLLEEPIRVGDPEAATALYTKIVRGSAFPSDSLTLLSKRTCVHVSVFVHRAENEHLAVEALSPRGGDFNFRLYLFKDAQPVIAMNERTARRITAAAAKELSSLNVPVIDEGRGQASCT